jgi:hypothetical protein
MVQARDHFPLSRPARNGRVSGRVPAQLGLLTRRQLTKVPQELEDPQRAWQLRFADAPQHTQGGFEQREQRRGSVLLPVPAYRLFLRMLDAVVHVALERPRAAGRVGVEPPARAHRGLGGCLPRLPREIFARLGDDSPWATAPRTKRRPVGVIMAPAGRALLAPATRAAAQRLLAAPCGWALVAGGGIEVIGLDCPFQLARSVVSQGGLAEPPTPAIARAAMAPYLPGEAMNLTATAARGPESKAGVPAGCAASECRGGPGRSAGRHGRDSVDTPSGSGNHPRHRHRDSDIAAIAGADLSNADDG